MRVIHKPAVNMAARSTFGSNKIYINPSPAKPIISFNQSFFPVNLGESIFNNLKVKGKTKEVVDILSKLKIGTSSCLIVLPEHDALFVKATNNIQKVSVMTAKDLNALDLMSFKYIVLNNDSIKKIKETFVK